MQQTSTFKSRWQEYSPMYLSQVLLLILITADYTLTTNINHQLGNVFYLLVLATLLFISLPLFKFYIAFKQRYAIIIGHYIVIGIFLCFFANIDSAYYFLLFFYLTVSMYWYGWRGYYSGLAAIIGITLLAMYVQFPTFGSAEIYHVGMYFAILVISTLYIALLMLRRPIEADARFLRDTASLERTRLTSLINSMGDAVIATGEKGIINIYNGAALALFNTNDSLEDEPLDYYLKLSDEKDNPVNILKLAGREHRLLKRDDLHFISNENTKVDVEVSISPIRSADLRNAQQGFILVVRDITKEKTLDQEKNEFVSVTSHELRTPIAIAEANIATVIRPGAAEKLDPATRHMLEQAHDNVVFLGGLINDLATLDRAEHGDLNIEVALVDPGLIISNLADDYAAQAKQAGLQIRVDKPDKIGSLLTSELYVKEILQNFITNALKYTKQGVVTLGVQEGKDSSVVFSIADTGIGIAAGEQKKIFTKFYRSEDYQTRQTRGTGLGLYITLKLARRIKAKIWFESELGKGSKFYLKVPPIGALKQDQQKVAKEEIKDFASSV